MSGTETPTVLLENSLPSIQIKAIFANMLHVHLIRSFVSLLLIGGFRRLLLLQINKFRFSHFRFHCL